MKPLRDTNSVPGLPVVSKGKALIKKVFKFKTFYVQEIRF